MISFEGGVLKVQFKGEEKAKLLYEFLFVVNIVTIFTCYEIKVVASITNVCLFLSSLLIWLGRKRTKEVLPYNFIWYGIFIIFAITSSLWSTYISANFWSMMLKMVMILLVITSISIYVDTPKNLDRLMSAFIFGMAINISLEFITVPVDSWFAGSMGSNISSFNPNEIAFWAVCAETMSFYKAYINNKKGFYILMLAFLFFAILTSSRKATLAALLAPVIMLVLATYKKKYFLKIILVICAVLFLGYLIMNNEKLYTVIGRRFDSMKNYYSDNTIKSDGSMWYRDYFIEVAKELFYKSPIVGVGMGNFAKILDVEYASKYAYVHNNYWQILSEFGIIGFVIYYSFYAFILVKLIKNMSFRKSRISTMFLTLMFLLIILEWGIVTVYGKTAQIIIAMIFTSTYVGEMDGRKYQYIQDNTNISEELQ